MEQARLVDSLRASGARLTPQRLLILEVIARQQGHLGVDEVYRRVQQAYPYLDVATVYRTLHLLKRLGLVNEVAVGDRQQYELAAGRPPHHHLLCRECSVTIDLGPSYLEELQRTIQGRFNFEPDLEHFTITGVCAVCRRKVKRRKAKARAAA
jgi:Fur family ferric uptake transcriptional regulator